MRPRLTATLARSFCELEQLREPWDRLAMTCRRPEVFHTFAWAQAWWRGYGQRFEVFSPVVRDADGQVVAIWPLVLSGSEIRTLGDGASDHHDLLAVPDNAQAALQAALSLLAENGRDWQTGIIRCVSARGSLLEAVRRVAGTSKVRVEVFHEGRGWAAVALTGPKFFLELARKESLRRHRRKLERVGRVTFRHIEDSAEIKTHLQGFQHQHIARWALKGIPSHFLDPASAAYYSALPVYLSPRGPLRFAVLEVEGRPVAYHLGFQIAGKYVWYKPTFDIDFSDFGPGEVMLQSIIEYCASAGVQELDFTIGDEPYKRRFSNLIYDIYRVHIFKRNSAKRFVILGRELVKQSNPNLYNYLKRKWSFLTKWIWRLRHALARDGVLTFTKKRLRHFVRRFIFRYDEVLVFFVSKHSEIRDRFATPDVEIVPFRFSLLAEAILQHPSHLSPSRLESFRQRMAQGDRGVVALHRGKLAHVAWVGRRNAIVATTETGPHCVLELPEEASVIYDCWTPEEFRGIGIYPAVLRLLVREEVRSGRDVWIYCLRENQASRAGIRKAGFVEAARFVRIVLFGRIERCQVIRDTGSETASSGGAGRKT
jgi:CelD/BcsL family acetyltransferase involved in cellulose biosynthesis